MNIELLWISSGNEEWLTKAIESYEKKIARFCKFKVFKISMKGQERSLADINRKNEAKEILKKIDEKTFVVVFDEKGVETDSISFAKQFGQTVEAQKKKVLYVIGGSYGLEDKIKSRANKILSLSKLTFSHHIAVVVALEQIYRAWNIRENRPYHNGDRA